MPDSGITRFNPHRLLGAGATWSHIRQMTDLCQFQSSPTPGSRCNTSVDVTTSPATGFNPHRLLGAGATSRATPIYRHTNRVSILTDSWEPVQPTIRCSARRIRRVSILTDSWEPVQQGVVTHKGDTTLAFQSSPTPGSRCNRLVL